MGKNWNVLFEWVSFQFSFLHVDGEMYPARVDYRPLVGGKYHVVVYAKQMQIGDAIDSNEPTLTMARLYCVRFLSDPVNYASSEQHTDNCNEEPAG